MERYALCYMAVVSLHYLNDICELLFIEKWFKERFEQGPFLVEFMGRVTLGIVLSGRMLHDVRLMSHVLSSLSEEAGWRVALIMQKEADLKDSPNN